MISALDAADSSRCSRQNGREPNVERYENNNNNNNNHEARLCSSRSEVADSSNNLDSNSSAQIKLRTSGSRSKLSSKLSSSSSSSNMSTTSSVAAANGPSSSLLNVSSAEYDRVRDTTLMFFLDRLFIASKEGQEARTLHDLSCLFGTKEFTKEMRQIVGASRNGLKKFLQSYPSLFTVDGDKVQLTRLKQDSPGTNQRDYNREAVEYFKEKLEQFGTSLVPIRNLFGYRSQASQEVRHVSGKNKHDFRKFLLANEDEFEILADDHVVLKKAIEELETMENKNELQQNVLKLHQQKSIERPLDSNKADRENVDISFEDSNSRSVSPPNVMDPYLNKQFAHTIESYIKDEMKLKSKEDPPQVNKFKLTLIELHEIIFKNCQNRLFLKMVETLDDLRVFLRMHPRLFKRSESSEGGSTEQVRLLDEDEKKELETQMFPSINQIQRQNSTMSSIAPNPDNGIYNERKSSLSHDFNSLPLNRVSSNGVDRIGSSHHRTPVSSMRSSDQSHLPVQHRQLSRAPSNSAQHQRSSSNQNSSIFSSQTSGSSSLRANAPPFVPSLRQKIARTQSAAVPAAANDGSIYRQTSSLTASSLADRRMNSPASSNHLQRSASNLTPRGSSGARRDSSNQPANHLARQAGPVDHLGAIRSYLMKAQQQNQTRGSRPNKFADSERANEERDIKANTVAIVRDASNMISRIMNSTDAVAFDCKGHNLGFDGQITLIQFGFIPKKQDSTQHEGQNLKPEVFVLDLITNPELAYCSQPLLESDKITKIVHDVRNKSNALYAQFNIIMKNVFDTQVANLVVQQQDTGKPAYKSRYISMNKLCEVYGNEELMKYRNLIKLKTRHSSSSSCSQASKLSDGGACGRVKDVNYWRTRPLTNPMIYEATMDIYCLIGGIYQNLQSRLRPEYRPLFEQLNMEGVMARIKPDEIRSAKKERKIDLEVIDLKRKLYSDTTSPIVLSNREIRLLRHIDLTEEVRRKIQQCKKVAKKLERLDMKAQGAQANPNTDDENLHSMSNCEKSLSLSTSSSLADADRRETNQENSSAQSMAADGGGSIDLDNPTGMMMMTNLIDSSMFDDLKDKMIESSSLLESLEDDTENFGEHGNSLSIHSHQGSDCCRCHCHHNSNPASLEVVANCATEATNQITLSDKNQNCSLPKQKTGETALNPTTTEPGKRPEDSSQDPAEKGHDRDDIGLPRVKSAVDMAIQCDLLN